VQVREGTAGKTGPVLLNLTPLPSSESPSSGCVTNVPTSVVADLRADPDGFYLNVATTEFPDGAVRGQFFGAPTEDGDDWLLYAAGAGLLVVGLAIESRQVDTRLVVEPRRLRPSLASSAPLSISPQTESVRGETADGGGGVVENRVEAGEHSCGSLAPPFPGAFLSRSEEDLFLNYRFG
jgi:hypothetical protein